MRRRGVQSRRYGITQFFRFQHLHIQAVFKDIHDRFVWVAVGGSQLKSAVFQYLSLLGGVPLFVGDPARTARSNDLKLEGIRGTPARNNSVFIACLGTALKRARIDQALGRAESA